MSLTGLKLRTNTIQQVRQFLTALNFQEIEPQLFSVADTLEPTIYPFKVGEHYLPTSPEAFLKQAMSKGFGDCFAISHAFRNLEGTGMLHNPEFIMAEWYQEGSDYRDMMMLTQQLVSNVLKLPPATWPVVSWTDAWSQTFNSPLADVIADNDMVAFAQNKGYNPDHATWEQLFNQIADNEIVSHFPQHPFFLIDYPAKISPLAKPRSDMPFVAERFELYINGIELANGNTEFFNTTAITSVLKIEQLQRGGLLYQDFLEALTKLNGQTWAGVGLGLDRLTMIRGNFTHIDQVQTI